MVEEHGQKCLSFAGNRQIQVGGNELFREQDDLPLVQLQMAGDALDRFENGHRPPTAPGLRIDRFQQTRGWKRPDHFRHSPRLRQSSGAPLRIAWRVRA